MNLPNTTKKQTTKKLKKQNCDLDLQSSPEQNHTSRPTENLQQNKKNKKILKQNSTKKEASASTNNSGDIAKTQEYNKKTKEQKSQSRPTKRLLQKTQKHIQQKKTDPKTIKKFNKKRGIRLHDCSCENTIATTRKI